MEKTVEGLLGRLTFSPWLVGSCGWEMLGRRREVCTDLPTDLPTYQIGFREVNRALWVAWVRNGGRGGCPGSAGPLCAIWAWCWPHLPGAVPHADMKEGRETLCLGKGTGVVRSPPCDASHGHTGGTHKAPAPQLPYWAGLYGTCCSLTSAWKNLSSLQWPARSSGGDGP